MSSFTDSLILRYLPNLNTWRTTRNFSYFVGEEYSKDKVIVPAGFRTDLASIPWPGSMFIPRSGKYNQCAVLHDFLYSILGEVSEPYNMRKRSRKECDGIFLEAMGVLGVNRFKRWLMYRAVRMGGGFPWRKHKKNLIKQNAPQSMAQKEKS